MENVFQPAPIYGVFPVFMRLLKLFPIINKRGNIYEIFPRYVIRYYFSIKYLSALNTAFAPSDAAVTIWRNAFVRTSPAAKMP